MHISTTARLSSSHLITTCATLAALTTLVSFGSQVFSGALPGQQAASPALGTALVLNVAIILFGWSRAKELKRALESQASAEAHAHLIAYRDHTTGLANRRELSRQLELHVSEGRGERALLLLDLDHFKKVNDLNGHAAGDAILKRVATSLLEVAPSASCCARLGGDEFAILMPDGMPQDLLHSVIERILEGTDQQVEMLGFTANTSASIGVSIVRPGTVAVDALRRSDIAMYVAKKTGRNRAVWFDAGMESQLQERLALEQEIREGIELGQFIPYFQPQIGLPSGDLTGFEVLARWQSPKRGLVEPSGFIEVAEASGLIAPLSLRVMRDALSEAAAWPDHLQVAVNISPVQFRDPLLAQRIQAVLVETSFPPHRLELEVTESSIFEDQQQALETVHKIKDLGIRLSLDDFGTGYASLTQLRALPFDRIKIDKSFVASLLTDQQSSAIVSTITSLGRALNLPITAEGVECRQVHEMIEALGCSSAQGWLFGRAMAGSDVQAMLSIAPIESHRIRPRSDLPEVQERRDRKRRSSLGAKSAA